MAIKIYNKSDKAAEIYISGQIVDDETGGLITDWGNPAGYEWPANIKEQLDGLKGKDLTIYINSEGGSVPAGVAMASMLKRHDGKTTAVVDGWCCSIATQIFFSCQERKIPENAYLMIHKPTITASGDADELKRVADILDTIQEGLETSYNAAALPEVTAEAIHEMVNAETWLTGRDAATLFDVEVLPAVSIAACAMAQEKALESIPKAIRDRMKAQKDAPKGEGPTGQAPTAGKDQETAKPYDWEKEKAEIAIALAVAAMKGS